MAAALQTLRRFLRPSGNLTSTVSRSAFVARRDDDVENPDWLKVSLMLGSTVALWILIFKQQNDHTREYERRKAERESQQMNQINDESSLG